jgi:hypothetical protein
MCKLNNCIDGVVVRVIQSIVVDRGFVPRSDQAKDYLIDSFASPQSKEH